MSQGYRDNNTEWTRSAIADELYLQMCKHDEREGVDDKSKYYIRAIKYANRRAIAKKRSDLRYFSVIQPDLWLKAKGATYEFMRR